MVGLAGGERLLVGRDADARRLLEQVMLSAGAVALGAALVLGLLAGWLLSRFVLSRIGEIQRTAGEIVEGDLARRVPMRGSGDEFDRMAGTLNAMLDRNEALVDSLRTVTDSLAHDLRSPLTRLRAITEELAAPDQAPERRADLAARATAEADGVLSNFSSLIEIARAEAGLGREAFQTVDLAEMADEIGALYRGEDMQITTYLEKAAAHELSANVIDLCPVGALTSRPYAFEARPWELKRTLSIDVSDAVGANISLHSKGREVMRALPRINDAVNEEWLSDKGRYQVDGLTKRRLDKVFVRKNGKLVASDWNEAFGVIAGALGSDKKSIAAVAGDMLDCETMFAAKALLKACGSSLIEARQTGMTYDVSNIAAVNFNSTFAGIETADAILIIGSHIRWEAALVNPRIRKAAKNGAKVFVIGPEWETTYPAEFVGNDLKILNRVPKAIGDAMKAAERPAVILGGAALAKGALAPALKLVDKFGLVKDGWNGFNVLHMSAARMGSLMLDFTVPGGMAEIAAAKPKVVFSLGADEMDFAPFAESLKVYIGHHGDKGAHAADIILPAASYAEKGGTYVNTEGRVQFAEKAVFAPGDAREDWTILRALAD
ncbi:MAG: molybdopterin-dependent oxidoreductase, partial [Pseudomonadota bacterium]